VASESGGRRVKLGILGILGMLGMLGMLVRAKPADVVLLKDSLLLASTNIDCCIGSDDVMFIVMEFM
jgi:hypothetical protein